VHPVTTVILADNNVCEAVADTIFTEFPAIQFAVPLPSSGVDRATAGDAPTGSSTGTSSENGESSAVGRGWQEMI
jgi:hypothetical protein